MRITFFILVRLFVFVFLGVNVRRREWLPIHGPAMVVANHNSHLDTLVLMSLFPLRKLSSVQPVGAADYFFKSCFLRWFATRIMRIVPIVRGQRGVGSDPLMPCYAALEEGKILILFPEGSRGEPEQVTAFKSGIAYLAERFPQAPVVPVFMHGLGKSLPKGEGLIVPFFCDVFIGEAVPFSSDRKVYMETLATRFHMLSTEKSFAVWE